MALRLRLMVTGVCPGVLMFAALCLLTSFPLSPHWAEEEVIQPEPLESHVPQATHNTARKSRVTKPQPQHIGRSLPVRYSGPCEHDQLCLRYLIPMDRNRFDQCVAKAVQFNVSQVENGTCRFVNRHSRDTVALASFPGSGNTWVRGLLEMATGICTGAFVCDISLRTRGFAGENIQSGSVLVVKTHRWSPWWTGEDKPAWMEGLHAEVAYSAAIVLVRNPFDALVAEWNREVANGFHTNTVTLGSHAETASPQWFGTNPQWSRFVNRKIKFWQAMMKSWVLDSVRRHPVLVVHYEDLQKDVIQQVKRMLDFLTFPYRDQDLRRNLKADFTTFRRPHTEAVNHFTPALKNVVKSAIQNITLEAKKCRLEHFLKLGDYLS